MIIRLENIQNVCYFEKIGMCIIILIHIQSSVIEIKFDIFISKNRFSNKSRRY